MLETLRERLQAHHPRYLNADLPRAAVLLAIVERREPTLVLTRRAGHLAQHGGQVAFPGGKAELEDADLWATALREAHEEIALPPSHVTCLGRLSDVISRHGICVTPFVGLIPPDLPLRPDHNELDTIFEVPLTWFLEDRRSHTDVIRHGEHTYYVPSYAYADHVIWGLSAMMLVELLAVGFARPISLDRAPLGSPLRHLPAPPPPRS
ncbi:CoA pyrophosphatase [Chromohalobacter canadensis]|uniref:CoA pyrophosphatase n=1 Tax=Chromohalobacter canadensis TaxID=141389 RepID=A0ABZ0YCY6_9GAMM|nr:CoA pyrophosphatase [Chromohalobacter canadensis]MCK0767601.1 CoA pyrophosphatase [Chromohalobacter canadensis]WQH09801.1 CoA pyrophosphatase [Chromohalobacter canadensis]